MSQFYASIYGSAKSEATRQGTKNTGISGHVRGWNAGVKVYGHYNQTEQRDEFDVYLTGGSGGAINDIYIGRVMDLPTGVEFHTYASPVVREEKP